MKHFIKDAKPILNSDLTSINPAKAQNLQKNHLPVKLVYFEKFDRIDKAFNREKQVQG
jgi:putative endonuclease